MSGHRDWSDKINYEWRIFPRLMILFYFLLCWDTLQWYQLLQAPSDSQAAVSIAIIGLFVPLGKWYMETGGKKQ